MLFSKAPACGWLVVGLGNPGLNYARTRHNVGFRAVDALAEKLGVKIDRARFRGLTAQASAGGEKLLLLKPQTFMNDSGLSVMDAARFYKLPPACSFCLTTFPFRSAVCASARTAPPGGTTASSPSSAG